MPKLKNNYFVKNTTVRACLAENQLKMTGILEERYWRDYYELKLLEVQNERSEEEKFYDMVENLSRLELPQEIIKQGL